MDYFNYRDAAREAGLSDSQLREVVEAVRRDFPADPMLEELHVLRACRAIRDGVVTLAQVLGTRTPAVRDG